MMGANIAFGKAVLPYADEITAKIAREATQADWASPANSKARVMATLEKSKKDRPIVSNVEYEPTVSGIEATAKINRQLSPSEEPTVKMNKPASTNTVAQASAKASNIEAGKPAVGSNAAVTSGNSNFMQNYGGLAMGLGAMGIGGLASSAMGGSFLGGAVVGGMIGAGSYAGYGAAAEAMTKSTNESISNFGKEYGGVMGQRAAMFAGSGLSGMVFGTATDRSSGTNRNRGARIQR